MATTKRPIRQRIRTWWRRPRRARRAPSKHFLAHKETARATITARVHYWNQFYQYSYGRIAIRNQRRRWGSCSSLGNLNFNYKLIFLPPDIMDYVVVHELCHLKELNHGANFWNEIAKTVPDYRTRMQELRAIERTHGISIVGLTRARGQHQARATTPGQPHSGVAPTACSEA